MSKMRFVLPLIIIGLFSLFSPALRAQVCKTCPSFTKTNAPAIKKLAGLVGCWKGKGPGGLAAKVIYEMGSDQTALLETIFIENNPTMYTVYYLDGEAGMAHHFCSYGNQLSMRSEPLAAPDTIFFKLVDGTNLPSLSHNHMNYVKFIFYNEDRFDVEWGLHHNGRDLPQLYAFRRTVQGCTARSDQW
jgi:hypothetical protein